MHEKRRTHFRFLDWPVYKDAKSLHKIIIKITNDCPKEYKFNICEQLLRSSLSIALNIAEGSGKHSKKELNKFINIALGSLYETIAGIDILRDSGFVKEENMAKINSLAVSISNQLGGLKKKLL